MRVVLLLLVPLLAWLARVGDAFPQSSPIVFRTESDLDKPCTVPSNRTGTCTYVQSCPHLQAEVDSIQGNQTRRRQVLLHLRPLQCGKDGRRKTLLCCDNSPPSTPTTNSQSKPSITNRNTSPSSNQPPINNPPPPPSTPPASTIEPEELIRARQSQCGESSFLPERVVGGEPVKALTTFPWMTALRYRDRVGLPKHRCGGAVIAHRWVLTAAHCVVEDGPISARVRDLILNTNTDDNPDERPQEMAVEAAFRHEGYRTQISGGRRGSINDIALLKLSESGNFSKILRPICLPQTKRTTQEVEQIGKVYIAGWGLTDFAGDRSSQMLFGTVNVTRHAVCQANYQQGGIEVQSLTHICANGDDKKFAQEGSGGVDTCEGDSGGPLMERRDDFGRNKAYAIGVTSFGTGCGNPDYPGIYTRVEEYLPWIYATIANNL